MRVSTPSIYRAKHQKQNQVECRPPLCILERPCNADIGLDYLAFDPGAKELCPMLGPWQCDFNRNQQRNIFSTRGVPMWPTSMQARQIYVTFTNLTRTPLSHVLLGNPGAKA
jgi:hypothetical protein